MDMDFWLRLVLVHLRDEIWVLALGGWEMVCGHELVAEKELFVFAIKGNDFHNEIEVLPNERGDGGILFTLGGVESHPRFFVGKERFLCAREAFKHAFAGLEQAIKIVHMAGLELLMFALHDG